MSFHTRKKRNAGKRDCHAGLAAPSIALATLGSGIHVDSGSEAGMTPGKNPGCFILQKQVYF